MQIFEYQLNRLAVRLAHQYRITFRVNPQELSGYKTLGMRTTTPNAELVSATKVYIPAAK
jgi:hypothetical protein